jgi:hypothetical protein
MYLQHILYVPLILQQIQISVDQPYAGPGCQLLHYQRDIYYILCVPLIPQQLAAGQLKFGFVAVLVGHILYI